MNYRQKKKHEKYVVAYKYGWKNYKILIKIKKSVIKLCKSSLYKFDRVAPHFDAVKREIYTINIKY